MSRIEHIAEGVTLYLGDCREILPTLGKVDAVVTDPPYGVRDDEWDDMDDREFARFSMRWLSEVRALSDELIVFCFTNNAVHRLCEMLYPRVRPMVWHKPIGSQYTGASERKRWFGYETILHCHQQATWSVVEPKALDVARLIKEGREVAGLSRGGVDMALRGKKTGLCFRWEEAACLPTEEQAAQLTRLLSLGEAFQRALEAAYAARDATKKRAAERAAERTDVLSYRTIGGPVHPTQKPHEMMHDLIETSCDEAKSILDPFMGSGSTGLAAVQLGRQFTGIELDNKYFDIACRRISEALKQRDLFVAKPDIVPKQESWHEMWKRPYTGPIAAE